MEKTVTLNPQEQQRIQVLNQHLRGDLSIAQVAALLRCTQRQVYRLKASYREKGVEAVIHGNRGKRSPRRIEEATRKQVSRLAQERYAGCNQHHLRDLLEEREGIQMSRASVRRILEQEGVLVVKAATRLAHRLRRPRYRQEGQLIQIDASPHDWLQERGPRLSLVGGIDDATGKVVGAVFREQEDQQGYMHLLRQVVEQYGCPQALYHDRHTMFPTSRHDATQQHSTEEQLAGSRTSTQLGRLFEQLQITSIAARSPQAKGRIERLWGTFQDRLVSELRLAGATTLHEANALVQEYLPRFNARFAVPATDPGLAWQRFPATLSLDDCFCLQEERTVALDNTISYHSQRVQLLPTAHRHSWVRCKVLVHAHFDGQLSVFFQGQSLPCRVAPADPAQLRTHITPSSLTTSAGGEAGPAAAGPASPPADVTAGVPQQSQGTSHKPKATYPWRRQAVSSRTS